MEKIWEIIKKEWSEVFKNRLVLGSVILMPLIFTIMPLVILNGMQGGADMEMADIASDMPEQFRGDVRGAVLCGLRPVLHPAAVPEPVPADADDDPGDDRLLQHCRRKEHPHAGAGAGHPDHHAWSCCWGKRWPA